MQLQSISIRSVPNNNFCVMISSLIWLNIYSYFCEELYVNFIHIRRTVKGGENKGRVYYSCFKLEGARCGYYRFQEDERCVDFLSWKQQKSLLVCCWWWSSGTPHMHGIHLFCTRNSQLSVVLVLCSQTFSWGQSTRLSSHATMVCGYMELEATACGTRLLYIWSTNHLVNIS